MANSREDLNNIRYATVDTTPGASGYWTTPVSMRPNQLSKLFFSFRGTGTMVPVVQFKCVGDSDWTDYYYNGEDWNVGERGIIEGAGAAVQWRSGIPNDAAYTSGECRFGFDW